MLKVEITKIDVSAKKTQKTTDFVATEKPLHIFLNGIYYATIFCSPSNLKELTIGHLLSEGIIRKIDEIAETIFKKTDICQVKLEPRINIKKRLQLSKRFSRVILSACGSQSPYQYLGETPKITSDLRVKAEVLLNCVTNLNFIAETFRRTGGVHAAAIYKRDGTLAAFAEDVGRHNAVDKVIGMAALNKNDLNECFLTLSGRLTGDIVMKAARVNMSIVASLASAINSGIAIAKDAGITLIGFVRGKRMNIYTFPERILNS